MYRIVFLIALFVIYGCSGKSNTCYTQARNGAGWKTVRVACGDAVDTVPVSQTSEALNQGCGAFAWQTFPGQVMSFPGPVNNTPVKWENYSGASEQCWGLESNGGGYFTPNVRFRSFAQVPFGSWWIWSQPSGADTRFIVRNVPPGAFAWYLSNADIAESSAFARCVLHDSAFPSSPPYYDYDTPSSCSPLAQGTTDQSMMMWGTGFQTAIFTLDRVNHDPNQPPFFLAFDPQTMGGDCSNSPALVEVPGGNNVQNGWTQPTGNDGVQMFQNSNGFTIGPNACGSYNGQNTFLGTDSSGNMIWSTSGAHTFQFVRDPSASQPVAALTDLNTGSCLTMTNVIGSGFAITGYTLTEVPCAFGNDLQYIVPMYK